MDKAPDAFRTISEVADWLDTPTHVLRFWESRFPQVAPVKRAGGRRYYRNEDMLLLGGIKKLLHEDGATIKSVQERLKSEGVDSVSSLSPPVTGGAAEQTPAAADSAVTDQDPEPAPTDAETLDVPEVIESAPADPPEQAELFAPEGPDDAEPAFRRHETSSGRSHTKRVHGFGPESVELEASAPAEPDAAPPPEEMMTFRRHPGRHATAEASPAPDPVDSHQTRSGLFVYDDGTVPPEPEPEPEDAAAVSPALGSIEAIPDDPEDSCAAPEPVSISADLRASIALATGTLPDPAFEAISQLQALRDRLG